MADYLLDTNILILHLRQRGDVTDMLARWGETSTPAISVITRTEILAGMRPSEEKRTLAMLDSLNCIGVDKVIADKAGRLIYQYARQGVQLAFPDVIIAATALLNRLTLATTNVKHFPMPDLQIHALAR